MLIALLLALLLGGGPNEGLIPDGSKSIKQEISDKSRAKEIMRQNASRSIETPAIQAAFSELESKRTVRRDRVINHLFGLRSKMTEQEWNRTYGSELKTIQKAEAGE